VFLVAPVAAATLGRSRHRQFRPYWIVLQIGHQQAHGLRRPRPGDRQHVHQHPELLIKRVSDADEVSDLVVAHDHVARLRRVRQTGESDFPRLGVPNALVVLRGQIERGGETAAEPVDRGRRYRG
jgi:hypothetical protein